MTSSEIRGSLGLSVSERQNLNGQLLEVMKLAGLAFDAIERDSFSMDEAMAVVEGANLFVETAKTFKGYAQRVNDRRSRGEGMT